MSEQLALTNISANLTGWLQTLYEHGYRLTQPLRVVTAVMVATNRALTPLEVFDLAREHYPKLGLTTVYRSLEKLESLKLVQRIHQSQECCAYVPAPSGHKHVLICEGCGQTEYFKGDHLDGLMAQVAAESGFEVRSHLLQFLGICGACQ